MLELMDDEARKDMAVIAAFDDEEIGSRMTTNYIEIRENLTVKQAMTELVSQAAKMTIFLQFYGDSGSHLLRCDGSEGSDHGKTGYTS